MCVQQFVIPAFPSGFRRVPCMYGDGESRGFDWMEFQRKRAGDSIRLRLALVTQGLETADQR